MKSFEINFDGIVGPTHNYAGLSYGNVASQKHALSRSNPKAAALQGLAKMKALHDLGIKQAVLPPHPRPDLEALRRLGFSGDDAAVLHAAHQQEPRLLATVYSASAMWAANAATVSPSADTADARVHFTPANLITQFHRSLEAPVTAATLRAIFAEGGHFAHHDPLPAADAFADEGAANHMRLCTDDGNRGIEIFVYGRSSFGGSSMPSHFPARQTQESAAAIVRRHQLNPDRVMLVQKSPEAIDSGAFHNDVVAVSNRNVLLCHASAWVDASRVMDEMRWKLAGDLHVYAATPEELSLRDAVETYVFNSQLVTLPHDGSMALIAPIECEHHPRVQRFLARVVGSGGPIRSIRYLDVRESMKNGGGPACLRLRVVLNEQELRAMNHRVMFDEKLYGVLMDWVQRYYRDSISADDLADSSLMIESRRALSELATILAVG